MPTANDLMGYGLSPFVAGELGNTPQSITAAGTSVGTAAQILTEGHVVLVTGASSQTGVILPPNAKIGTPYFIIGVGSAAPVVYAVNPIVINSAAASVTLSAAISAGIFIRTSSTQWYTIPLAP